MMCKVASLAWCMFAMPVQVQKRWHAPLMCACICLKQALQEAGFTESQHLGLYVRGSLPQGCAVEHISDIDLAAYVLLAQSQTGASTHNEAQAALQKHVRIARKRAVADFDFVVKAGVPPTPPFHSHLFLRMVYSCFDSSSCNLAEL